MAINDSLIDKRVVSRNLAKGLVDAKELEKHLKALPDVADNGETVSYEDDSDMDSNED